MVLAGVNWSETLANEIAGPSDNLQGLSVKKMDPLCAHQLPTFAMFALLATDNVFDLVSDYATPYDTARGTYLSAAQALKEATGPYKAARDAYVAATATYTKSLYE